MANSKATQDTNTMQKIKTFIKRRTKKQIVFAAVFVVVAIVIFGGGESKREEVVVERGEIRQEVIATGKIRSAEEVDLGFERGGKVVKVNAKVGDNVKEGAVLVVLDQTELLAKLKKAKAELSEALIGLDKAQKTTALDASNTYDKLYIALIDAYTEARDAVLNTADRFFNNPESASPYVEIVYVSSGQYIEFFVDDDSARSLSVDRAQVGEILTLWTQKIDALRASKGDLSEVLALSEKNIDEVKIFLGDIALVLSTIKGNSQTEDNILDGFRSSVSAARTSLNTSLNTLLTAKANYLSSPKEIMIGSKINFDSILEEEARAEVALAEVETLESELGKTVLSTPISGVVTKQEAQLGEIVSTGEIIASVIGDNTLEIVSDISEINIGKIIEGDPVSIELDAFPGEIITGRVAYIEPGEKLVDGVVNYEVTITFTGPIPQGARKGLTATLNIETERREGVLRVPLYAVERRGEKRFVTLKTEAGEEERQVKLGISGADGFVEILEGLSEGDIVFGASI